MIGACYLAHGFERDRGGRGRAPSPGEIEYAQQERLDFKSELQERLARDGTTVSYEVVREAGPPHDRRFEVRATVAGDEVGVGSGPQQEGGRAGRRREGAGGTAAVGASRVRFGREPCAARTDMYLKAINLKGFKSFPDRTRLTFSPGVSVIVGPNGCGKSNITDAVLWALGEQSPRAVRGQSMRDVIFAGGKGQSRRRFAEVEVVIDNSEGRAASEFSEISITRRIERNGDGEYRLNGARCRLADVLEVLSDTNMGREMHSVISQGRVEAIVNSKPRDRRMLIEEAAGLGKHRKRRHRAQLKLERTRENLDRALDVEREARSRLRPLKRQAEAAERTAKLVAEEDELRSRRLVAAELREQRGPARRRPRRRSPRSREARRGRGAARARSASAAPRSRSGSPPARTSAAAAPSASPRRAARRRAGPRPRRGDRPRPSASCAPASASASCAWRSSATSPRSRARRPSGSRSSRPSSQELERRRGRSRSSPSCARPPRRAEAARAEAEAALPALEAAEAGGRGARRARPQLRDAARAESEKAAERLAALARASSPRSRRSSPAPRWRATDEVLAGMIETGPGHRAGALGRARRAAARRGRRLDRRGRRALGDERGRLARAGRRDGRRSAAPTGEPPVEGARRLLDLVQAEGAAGRGRRAAARRRLAGRRPAELPEDFAASRSPSTATPTTAPPASCAGCPREGTDPALAARSAREELVSRLEQREQTAERATRELEQAEEALATARAERDETDHALREARRRLDEAAEEARRTTWLAERRAERDEDGAADASSARQLEAELAAERRHAEAAKKAGEAREPRPRAAAQPDRAGARDAAGAGAAAARRCSASSSALERRAELLAAAGGEEGGGEVAAELRECSQQEYELQGEMREVSEALTTAEVETAQLRDRRDESRSRADRLGGTPRAGAGRRRGPEHRASARRSRRKLERLDAPPRADRPGQPAGQDGVRGGRTSTSAS